MHKRWQWSWRGSNPHLSAQEILVSCQRPWALQYSPPRLHSAKLPARGKCSVRDLLARRASRSTRSGVFQIGALPVELQPLLDKCDALGNVGIYPVNFESQAFVGSVDPDRRWSCGRWRCQSSVSCRPRAIQTRRKPSRPGGRKRVTRHRSSRSKGH